MIVKLFWTGGWDSTFRLLDLILIQKKIVQPHYIVDKTRRSLSNELETIEKIKSRIHKKYPETKSLLLEPKKFNREDIEAYQPITEQYKSILLTRYIGDQYEFLARYVHQFGIDDLELGVEIGGHLEKLLRQNIMPIVEKGITNFKLVENPEPKELKMLKNFLFPLIKLTKQEMNTIAQKYGFSDILNMIWFCHRPKDNKPCGVCVPCMIAMKSKHYRFFPVKSIVRYWFHQITWRINYETNKISKRL